MDDATDRRGPAESKLATWAVRARRSPALGEPCVLPAANVRTRLSYSPPAQTGEKRKLRSDPRRLRDSRAGSIEALRG